MENGMEEELFNFQIVRELDFTKCPVTLGDGISATCPGSSLQMRSLTSGDYNRGFLQLLSQLTVIGDISKELFLERFHGMKNSNGAYFVIVIEETCTNKIVASATLEVEQKFIRQCAIRGRIEEVIVLNEYRGKQLGKLLMATLTLLSQKLGCYKTTLECVEDNIPFYEKFGYKPENELYLVNRHRPKVPLH